MLCLPVEVAIMKTARLLFAASALLAVSCAFAQSQSYPATPVPPPPGLNDPGVTPAPAPATSAATPVDGQVLDLKPQALPALQGDVTQPASDDSLPEIKVRQDGEDTIQEYSRNGRVYMVVVTPRHGPQQTYMVDPQGRWVDERGQRRATPTLYKVLEWGKSPPASRPSGEAGAAAPASSSSR